MWNEVNNLEMVLVWFECIIPYISYFGDILLTKMSDSHSGDWPNLMHNYFD